MKKSLIATLSLSLLSPFVPAEPKNPATVNPEAPKTEKKTDGAKPKK